MSSTTKNLCSLLASKWSSQDDSGLTVHGTKTPRKKIKESRAEARHLLANLSIQARSLAQFLGKLNATSPALQMVPLFCRSLQLSIRQSLAANSQDYQSPVKLSPQAVEDSQWWEQHLISWNRRSFISPASIIVIHSSMQGWGATCKGKSTRSPWSPQEQTIHINCLEIPAATLAIQTLPKRN